MITQCECDLRLDVGLLVIVFRYAEGKDRSKLF